ncbi:MAG: GNAT family N-acetyltransferase [bacterium]
MNVTLKSLKKLCAELRKEEKIMQSRINPKKILQLHKRGLCYFLKDKEDTKIIGFGALWPTKLEGWYELGTMWVDKNHRCHGSGWKVFEKTIEIAPKESVLFLVTRSLKVVHMANYHEWEEAPLWQNSTQWKKVCEPWDKKPREATRIFPKEGRLFYHIALS